MILVLRVVAAIVMLAALAETGWRLTDSTDSLRADGLKPGLCGRLQPQLQLFLVSAILYLLTLFPRLWRQGPGVEPPAVIPLEGVGRPQPVQGQSETTAPVPLAQPVSQENKSRGDPFHFGND